MDEILMKQYKDLQIQIDKSKISKKPVDDLVKKQIAILENIHDEFVKSANATDANTLEIAKVEVGQYSFIKKLAEKTGLPTDKYDQAINKIKVSMLGEKIATLEKGK